MFLTFLVSTALADLAPPPGFVETCTADEQCTPGEESRECRATHKQRDACDHLLEEGWERRCKTSGASVWREVFCRPAGPVDGSEEATGGEAGEPGAEAGQPNDGADATEPAADETTEEAGAAEPDPAADPEQDAEHGVDSPDRGCASAAPAALPGLSALLLVGLALTRRRAQRG